MKTKFLFLLIIIFSISLGSCTLEKRVHRKGYHVELIKKHNEQLANTKSSAKEQFKHERIKVTKPIITIDNNQRKLIENNFIKTDDNPSKLNLFSSSKRKTFNISKKKISISSKPSQNHSNYKFIDSKPEKEKKETTVQKRRLTILEKLILSFLFIFLGIGFAVPFLMVGWGVAFFWTLAICIIMLLATWFLPFKTKAPKIERFTPFKERRKKIIKRDKQLKNKKVKISYYILGILAIIMTLSDVLPLYFS